MNYLGKHKGTLPPAYCYVCRQYVEIGGKQTVQTRFGYVHSGRKHRKCEERA